MKAVNMHSNIERFMLHKVIKDPLNTFQYVNLQKNTKALRRIFGAHFFQKN